MSHEIASRADGRAAMAFTGDTPWHGLGHNLTPGAPLEDWQREAGLDYSVASAPVEYHTEDGEHRRAAGQKVLYRSDNAQSLAVVSDRYQVLQPGDVMAFYRDLTEAQGYTMETAGVLKGGRRVWALARAPQEDFAVGGDLMQGYVLLATSYDGTMATVASHTTVRVVCHNTLSMAVGAGGERGDIKIPHNTSFDADAVKARLGLRPDLVARFQENAEAMARKQVSKDAAVRFFLNVYYPDQETLEVTRAVNRRLEELVTLWNTAPGQETDAARGTAWGLLNAVTYHTDHARNTRTQENRLEAAWFGTGATTKARAAFEARKLAEVA